MNKQIAISSTVSAVLAFSLGWTLSKSVNTQPDSGTNLPTEEQVQTTTTSTNTAVFNQEEAIKPIDIQSAKSSSDNEQKKVIEESLVRELQDTPIQFENLKRKHEEAQRLITRH